MQSSQSGVTGICRTMLQAVAFGKPYTEVQECPLPGEHVADVAPMLDLAYGELQTAALRP